MAFPTVPGEWIATTEAMPEPETIVLIWIDGKPRVGCLCWDYPGYEDSYQPYTYWDDPEDDGKDWPHEDVTHWQPIVEPK